MSDIDIDVIDGIHTDIMNIIASSEAISNELITVRDLIIDKVVDDLKYDKKMADGIKNMMKTHISVDAIPDISIEFYSDVAAFLNDIKMSSGEITKKENTNGHK